MQFRDVLGQAVLKKQFVDLVDKNRLPHAILFSEKEGYGALGLSIALAQYILCTDRNNEDSCGKCSHCNMLSQLRHPDLHFSFPIYKKQAGKDSLCNDFLPEFRHFALTSPYGAVRDWMNEISQEKKQGNIPAAECRDIIQKMYLKSMLSPIKILIIWSAELLGKEGNILLKLIEEPPKNTVIILVTSQEDKILGTIHSRIRSFKLRPVDEKSMTGFLMDTGIESRQATIAARISEGNMGKALQLSANLQNDYFDALKRWLNAILTQNEPDLALWIEQAGQWSRDEIISYLNYFIHLLENGIRRHFARTDELPLTHEEQIFTGKLMQMVSNEQIIENLSKELEKSIYHISRNAQIKLLLHSLSYQIMELLGHTG